MNKKRLLKLADLLEADAKNAKGIKFDLGLWGRVPVNSSHELPDAVKPDCGTYACAVGLACISGAFKRSGLTAIVVSQDAGAGNNILPFYKGRREWAAVESFFELTFHQARFLFANSMYLAEMTHAAGERRVAKRIREFVAGRATP